MYAPHACARVLLLFGGDGLSRDFPRFRLATPVRPLRESNSEVQDTQQYQSPIIWSIERMGRGCDCRKATPMIPGICVLGGGGGCRGLQGLFGAHRCRVFGITCRWGTVGAGGRGKVRCTFVGGWTSHHGAADTHTRHWPHRQSCGLHREEGTRDGPMDGPCGLEGGPCFAEPPTRVSA